MRERDEVRMKMVIVKDDDDDEVQGAMMPQVGVVGLV